MIRLMIAGGGTGGHLFPGVAVAEEFLRRDPESKILFIGTGRPVEAEVLEKRGLASRTITAGGLKGISLVGRLKSLAALPRGLFQAMGLIADFKPDMVLGVGGYVSGPVGLAARLMGRPTAIQEQNSIPGLTNRMLGRIVDLIFIAFESSRRYFPEPKTMLTGNPIRTEIAALAGRQRPENPGFTLLIVGGSQGAHAVNTAVVEAMKILGPGGPVTTLIHQTGVSDMETVQKAYEENGIRAEVKAFIQDMDRVYMQADLVICRAGAITVAEVAAAGLPAVFIPLPTAADNHQEFNARWLVDEGAAEIMPQSGLTPEGLAATIRRLAGDAEKRRDMSRAAANAAVPDAVRKICDLCQDHIRKKRPGAEVNHVS